MSMRMFALDASQIEGTWKDYEHLFERFERSTGEMAAEHIKRAASESLMQIWGLQDEEGVYAVVGTEFIRTARGLVCQITAAAGDAPLGIQRRLLDEIGRWAKSQQCVAVRIIGRKGWLRRFPYFRKTGMVAEWSLRTH